MASEARQVCRWPYAASSTGRYLGQLKLHILKGRVGCWEAVGQAREEFSNVIGPKLAVCIENNSDKLADSEVLINFALFMIGNSPQRTKPTIMFVSRDKAARLEARKAVQESGMLAAYPGFETGHCSQVAEFRDLRQFGGQSEGSDETVYTRGGRVTEGTLLFLSNGDANDDDEPTPRAMATAGGFLSFGQQYFLLTVAHPFRNRQSQKEIADEVDENECEISGVEFSEDGEDGPLVDVTSRGSLTPEARGLLDGEDVADGDPMSRSSEEEEGTHFESSSPQNFPLTVPVGTARGENADIYYDLSREGSSLERIGMTEYVSFELDYALIRLDSSAVRSLSMPLSTYNLEEPSTWNLRDGLHDCSTTLLRRDGQVVSGNISGNPIFTRLPGTKRFSKLYAAILEQHVAPGDCGAWVRDSEAGALLGHVVAGSDATGLALVMPARLCFDDITTILAARFSPYHGNFEAIIVQQNQKKPPPKIPSEPDWPKGQCRYILLLPEIKGQRCGCVAYTHNASIPGSACDCGHLACFHLREEMSAKADDSLEALKTRLTHLESIMAKKSMARFSERLLSASEDQEQVERKVATFIEDNKLGKVSEEELEKLSKKGSKTYQRVEKTSSRPGSAPENDGVVKVNSPWSVINEIWTAHISLLPYGSMSTPFERNTNAYQRCLSRGLHQMVVIDGPSAESFIQAVEKVFGIFLQGRPWVPLQAELSPKEGLYGLPTLRHLPYDLENQPYTADFLRENCAVCDRKGVMDSIYIAMKSHTLSWRTLRHSPVFMDGLEECWAYDSLLDFDDSFKGNGLDDADRPAAGDIVSLPKRLPPFVPPLVELSRTTGHLTESGSIPERKPKRFKEEAWRSEVAR